VRAGLDQLFGEVEVVVERVEPLLRVAEVAGVAERAFGDRAGLEHGGDRRPHRVDVVQRVKDAEDVDPGGGALGDEGVYDTIGVGLIAEQVAPAQQHLQADVRDLCAQRRQPGPRVLVEEAQRDVERCPTPDLEREQLRQ
jgi:hypothetical protein